MDTSRLCWDHEVYEIINNIIGFHKFNNYLEIGIDSGYTFYRVGCKNKVGVDPNPKTSRFDALASMIRAKENGQWEIIAPFTSDDFFKRLNEYDGIVVPKEYDVIFIDGLHEHKQVIKDIDNAIKHLSAEGYILIHDTNPKTEDMAKPYVEGMDIIGNWCGDVWRAIDGIKHMKFVTIDVPYGLTILRKQAIHFDESGWDLKYDYLDKNRKDILRIQQSCHLPI